MGSTSLRLGKTHPLLLVERSLKELLIPRALAQKKYMPAACCRRLRIKLNLGELPTSLLVVKLAIYSTMY